MLSAPSAADHSTRRFALRGRAPLPRKELMPAPPTCASRLYRLRYCPSTWQDCYHRGKLSPCLGDLSSTWRRARWDQTCNWRTTRFRHRPDLPLEIIIRALAPFRRWGQILLLAIVGVWDHMVFVWH